VLFLEHEIYLSVYENPPRPTRCLLFANAMVLCVEALVSLWPTHNPEENFLYAVRYLTSQYICKYTSHLKAFSFWNLEWRHVMVIITVLSRLVQWSWC